MSTGKRHLYYLFLKQTFGLKKTKVGTLFKSNKMSGPGIEESERAAFNVKIMQRLEEFYFDEQGAKKEPKHCSP